MAQQIATISLCIFIIVVQHLYNWGMRKTYDKTEEAGIPLLFGLTIAVCALTFMLFNLLLQINK